MPLPPSSSVPSKASPIPKDLLEELLGCQVVNYVVENGSKLGDGYMSVMHAVTVDVLPLPNPSTKNNGKEPVKETRHLLLKCFPTHPGRLGFLTSTNVFYNELSFYRDWVKALHDFQTDVVGLSKADMVIPAFPPFVGGRGADFSKLKEDEIKKHCGSLDNFIAMTNLKKEGFKLADKAGGLDLDHLTLAFTELAKEHALGWAYKNKVDWDVVKKFPFLEARIGKEDFSIWENVSQSRLTTAKKTLDGILGEGNHLSKSTLTIRTKTAEVIRWFLEQRETCENEAWKLHRSPPSEMVEASINDEPWSLQLHGDIWSNNALFKYNASGKPERIILLDFQLTKEGCPTADLVYLVYTSTSPKFRKAHLDSLLQLYCDKFTEFCNRLDVPVLPGFSFESLKRRFHRAKPIGYLMVSVLLPMMLADSSQETNMEEASEDNSLEEMVTGDYDKYAMASPVYQEKIKDVAQELYDQGVI